MTLEAFRQTFEPYLSHVVKNQCDRYRNYTLDTTILTFINHLNPLTLSGGKRVRPYLTDIMYRLGSEKDRGVILPLLAAIELFHTFCLIHDDIIDLGRCRHGVPTIQAYAETWLSDKKRGGNVAHIAMSQALLVGDLLFSCVMQLMSHLPLIHESLLIRAKSIFFRMIDEVVVGQMIDVDVTSREIVPMSLVEEKMRLKTARYTFVNPLQIGLALSTSLNSDKVVFCERFGTALGLAFQIQDDLIDLITEPESSGKSRFNDIAQRQHTVFTTYILSNGSSRQRQALINLWHGKENLDQAAIMDLFENSGALSYGKDKINQYFREAEQTLKQSSIPQATQGELGQLVTHLESRLN